jgi:hypothetical protein
LIHQLEGRQRQSHLNKSWYIHYQRVHLSLHYAFAALKTDGSITAWGRSGYGGSGAPSGSGYTKIYSTSRAFAALKADGSIKAWGDPDFGGENATTEKGYTKIYSIQS